MIEKTKIDDVIEAVMQELHRAFGVKGRSLAEAVRKAGRRLPRRLREQARVLVEADTVRAHPKLARTIDMASVSKAQRELTTFLQSVDRWDHRKGAVLGVLSCNAVNFLVIAGGLVAILVWRGLI